MRLVVLDSSALLALLFSEERAKAIEPFLDSDLYISTVNMFEVAEVGRRKNAQITPQLIRQHLEKLHIIAVPFSEHHAFVAANFAAVTRKNGLSLGDNACLALAKELSAELLTTDAMWARLALRMPIHVIA